MKNTIKLSAVAICALSTCLAVTCGALQKSGFTITSSVISSDNVLPVQFTGDGDGISPPLEWSGAPEGTKSYALIMHHVDPEGAIKWYWTIYNIPAATHSLAEGVKNVGTTGSNSVNKQVGYAPPHSQGPGAKTYTITLYALSQTLQITKQPSEVNRELLQEAMKGRTLGQAELSVVYTRNVTAGTTNATGPNTGKEANANGQKNPDGQRNEPRNAPPSREASETLTAAQVAQIKAILTKYNANTLTAEQAKAIHEAFRNAGIPGGPSLNDAVKSAGFDPDKLRSLAPPPDQNQGGNSPAQNGNDNRKQDGGNRPANQGPKQGPNQRPNGGGANQYTIEQAISDRAQLNTIAFDGLAFLTGNLGANTFLPPGKVADYCGFQYMRDVDVNQLGHNTSFVPKAANNMLYILTDEQKAKLIALAKEQEPMLTSFAYKRFPLIKGFTRQLTGETPSGSVNLNKQAVMTYTAAIYDIDGQLSYRRAEVLGSIVRNLTAKQKAYLAKMVFNNSSTWPDLDDQVDKQSMSKTAHVAVMTYASEMYSWYAGNVEADVYFCPERHATYFGSFYMKDIPAMGSDNYSISTSLTGDSGETFLTILTETQRKLITSLVEQQRADLTEIVKTRREIATELRRFMNEPAVDKQKVMTLSKRYGELDGEISYYYATAFAKVGKTLTADQKAALLKLRNLDPKFICKGAYIFSQPIDMPEIQNTDFLFRATK